jgi:hypothetical protein
MLHKTNKQLSAGQAKRYLETLRKDPDNGYTVNNLVPAPADLKR